MLAFPPIPTSHGNTNSNFSINFLKYHQKHPQKIFACGGLPYKLLYGYHILQRWGILVWIFTMGIRKVDTEISCGYTKSVIKFQDNHLEISARYWNSKSGTQNRDSNLNRINTFDPEISCGCTFLWYWNSKWVWKLDTEIPCGYTKSRLRSHTGHKVDTEILYGYTKSRLRSHTATQSRYWNPMRVHKVEAQIPHR